MHIEIALVALFAVATAVALVARRFKLPYTVALVIAGLALGTARAFEAPRLTKELLYAVFLPGLLFEAAYALEFRRFWQNKLAVFSLAMPGLVAAIAMTAGVLVPAVNGLHFVDHYTLGEGLVFASLIAATDPIAVVALFKTFGTPKRLAVLVEGESLLNDGTAVVVFSLVLALVMGKPMSLSLAILDFARVVGMGVLIGAAVGYAVSMVIHKVDDPMIEITLTTIGAYGSFVAAEFFHYSGVIAVVTSGMLCGNYAARTGMSASTRVAVSSFWEYLAFALNSLVFLLIGFEVKVEKILEAWKPILIAYVSVLLVRAIVIHVVGFLLRGTRERFPLAWANVLTWGGLRGSLSMVLVLALPQEFPHRDLVVAMTFGVVILSILVQGLTMGPLLRRLKLVGISEGRAEYDRLKGALSAVNAALVEVEKMEIERGIPKVVTDEVRAHYARRADEYEEAVADLHLKAERLLEEDRLRAARRALIAEKDALVTAYKSGQIAEESYEHLVADVDARLFELEAGESDGH
ncbi:MAG: cation:proton antiporter [Myxococcales bacterium]|nr:cation:proton antiporter [Myxococcales bacterium]